MKSAILTTICAAVLALSACRNDPAPVNPKEPDPAKPKPEAGTTIHVGDDGVAVESNGSSVNVSGDSADIEIKPK